MTVKMISSRKCISKSTVRAHCRKGYYQGAYKKGGRWIIPEGNQTLTEIDWQQLSFFPLLTAK